MKTSEKTKTIKLVPKINKYFKVTKMSEHEFQSFFDFPSFEIATVEISLFFYFENVNF